MKKSKKHTLGDSRVHAFVKRMNVIQLFYTSVCLLVLATGFLISAYVIQRHTNKPVHTPTAFVGYGRNTPVTMGVATMEVTAISYSDGQPGFSAPSGSHYVIVDLTIKNNADHPIDIFPTSDTYVKDQSGKLSYVTPFVVEQPFRAGALLPGEQVKGQLSYMITKTSNAKLFIDSIWSGGVVSFKIQ